MSIKPTFSDVASIACLRLEVSSNKDGKFGWRLSLPPFYHFSDELYSGVDLKPVYKFDTALEASHAGANWLRINCPNFWRDCQQEAKDGIIYRLAQKKK